MENQTQSKKQKTTLTLNYLNLIMSVVLLISILNPPKQEGVHVVSEEGMKRIKQLSFDNGKLYYELGVVVYASEHKNDSVMLTTKQLDRINKIVDSITVASKTQY